MDKFSVLGRGLKTLIPEQKEEQGASLKIVELLISDVLPNENQPRTDFDQKSLDDLMNSIHEKGLMQPITVRPKGMKYEIVAGERRYRACRQLNMAKISAVIKDVNEAESFQLAIIENIQRQDLNPIERALAFKRLIEDFGFTHQDLAKKVSVQRPTVTNTIRLLGLPSIIQEKIREGLVSFGHAKVILSLSTESQQLEMLEKILEQNLSVRDTEQEVKEVLQKKKSKKKAIDPNILNLQEKLKQKMGTKVKIDHNSKKNKGSIKIEYYSNDDLSRILELIR